jgi:DNA-directed RNA polymerase subunit RPC12/RpoP
MEHRAPVTPKSRRSFDSAFSFSFAIALGLVLFIGGLVISLTLGEGTGLGLIFGIPMLVAGLVLPLIMLRDVLKHTVVSGPCPFCSAPIKTSDATIRLNCPSCNRKLLVRDERIEAAEDSSAG